MDPLAIAQEINRRTFLRRSSYGLGAVLGLLRSNAVAGTTDAASVPSPHFKPTAKRVIYLFQSGAPSQFELFDHKPMLAKYHKTELPAEVRMGQRLTGMTADQEHFPIAQSVFNFQQHGESGLWLSELLPHTGRIADDICIIKSMATNAINHDPAITFCQTGSQLGGRPSMGAWVAYGLGSANANLPAFMVMISKGSGRLVDQPLYDKLWGNGMLPGRYQGVRLRNAADPVLYLGDPAGCPRDAARDTLDHIQTLNAIRHESVNDPEILTRIEQFELAFRMQTAVPDLMDISDEPQHVLDMYGPEVHTPGSYARNCLLARRMAERDVRFVQLYHMGWDQHDALPDHLPKQCRDTDQPSAALVADLKQRGLLDDTIVIWGGEFGRTVYSQGVMTPESYGRDHHPRCFSIWLAGGGIKPGLSWGATDDFGYNVVENPVPVADLNATILQCLGLDHQRLSVQHQGLEVRLTGVEEQHPVEGILA